MVFRPSTPVAATPKVVVPAQERPVIATLPVAQSALISTLSSLIGVGLAFAIDPFDDILEGIDFEIDPVVLNPSDPLVPSPALEIKA